MSMIYILEDDQNIREIESYSLKSSGYCCNPETQNVPAVMELISRVKAIMRRFQRLEEEKFMCLHEIFLDNEKRMVYVDDRPCELTHKEFELLKLFLQNAGIVMPRESIMERVWGIDFEGGSRTLDMHIKTLRQKLGDAGKYIKTVRNVGYRIE